MKRKKVAESARMIQDENPDVKYTPEELDRLAEERLNRGYRSSGVKHDEFSDRYKKLRALGITMTDVNGSSVSDLDNLAARNGLIWDTSLRDYVSRAGHGSRKRARYTPNRPIGHGFRIDLLVMVSCRVL